MAKYKVAFGLSTAMILGAVFLVPSSDTWAATCPTAGSLAVDGEVSSEAELRYAMLGSNGISGVKIGNDFTITCTNASYTDLIKKDFTIDLNGKTLTSQMSWALDIETAGKTLTIKDTSEGASGLYTFSEGGFWVDSGANLIIESGNIQSVNGGRRAILFNGGGKLTINGGTILTTPANVSDGNGRTVMVYNSNFEMNGGEVVAAKATGGVSGVGALYLQNTEAVINNGEIRSTDGTGIRALNSNVIFKDGEISGTDETISLTGSSFTMNDGEVDATSGVAVYTGKDSKFIMNNGTVVASGYALAGNGSVDASGEPLYGNTEWTLNGGTIVSEKQTALYQSQVGTTYLGKNLKVKGERAGIEIRAGSLAIDGAEVIVTGENAYTVVPNGNGATTTGAAVAVAQHTTRKKIDLSIISGSFIGPVAFSEADPQDGDPVDVKFAITGGAFVGDIVSEDKNKDDFVTGGDFVNHLEAEDGKAMVDISGSIVAKSELRFTAEELEDSSDLVLAESDNETVLISAYDLGFEDDDGVVSVSEDDGVELTVFVKLTDEQYKALKDYEKKVVVYFDEDGAEKERIEAELRQLDNGSWYLVFVTNHLSTYGIAGINSVQEEPEEESEGESGETGKSEETVEIVSPESGTMTAAGASASAAALVTAVIIGLITSVVSFVFLIRKR